VNERLSLIVPAVAGECARGRRFESECRKRAEQGDGHRRFSGREHESCSVQGVRDAKRLADFARLQG
jgi:hypothetical protein